MSTIGIATLVSSLVILLGKLVITAGCTIIAYIWLDTAIKCSESTMSATECSDSGIMRPDSPVLPLIFVAIFAYGIAVVFLGVYDMGIETIIVSFCIDKEENSEGQYMYPPTLASVMGAKGKVRTAEDEPDKSAAETTSSYKLPDDNPTREESDGDFI